MPRTAAAITITLMLLTTIVVWQVMELGATKSFSATIVQSDASQTATDYYEAINSTLETGDPTALRSVLHPNFIDHTHDREESGTSQELESYLLALRSTFPGLRFTASTIIAHGPVIASTLTITGDATGTFEEIPVELEASGAGYDLLRIDDNQVIERWASPALPALPQIDSSAAIEALEPAISPRTPRLDRLTFEQFARYKAYAHGGTILLVESGTVRVDASTGTMPGEELSAGDALTIHPRTSFELSNAELQASSILLLTIPLFDRADEPESSTRPAPFPPGVARDMRFSGSTIALNSDPLSISVRQIRIAPGTLISTHQVAHSEIMLVSAGGIETTVHSGAAELLNERGQNPVQSGTLVLSTGQGIKAFPGAEVAYRAAGQSPATIVLVTLAPAGGPR